MYEVNVFGGQLDFKKKENLFCLMRFYKIQKRRGGIDISENNI